MLGSRNCLSVAVAPLIISGPSDRRILVGRNVTWRCRATAEPEARFRWQKDGVDLAESASISITRDGSELTVLDLRPDDAGRYTCVAVNYVGSVNASAELHVIGTNVIPCNVVKVYR